MKCQIPEISWHNRDPVLSVDFQPKTIGSDKYLRLASGGSGKRTKKIIIFGFQCVTLKYCQIPMFSSGM